MACGYPALPSTLRTRSRPAAWDGHTRGCSGLVSCRPPRRGQDRLAPAWYRHRRHASPGIWGIPMRARILSRTYLPGPWATISTSSRYARNTADLDRIRAASVPERAGNCGRQRSPTGQAQRPPAWARAGWPPAWNDLL